MELIKDYDCVIDYHPGKANVVAGTLSRKTNAKASSIECSFVIDRRWYNSDRIDSETKFIESSVRGTKER